jgi:hypothetical protein
VDHDVANTPYSINIYDTQEIVHIVDFMLYEFQLFALHCVGIELSTLDYNEQNPF